MKKKLTALALILAMVLLLPGCSRGKDEPVPLPDGMDEEILLAAGETVVEQLVAGEYETVYNQLREDVRAELTADSVRDMAEPVFEKAGEFKEITESAVEGSEEGETHGVAGFLCKFSKEKVTVNAAFDPEMELIGLSVQSQAKSFHFSNITRNLSEMFGK